MPSLRALSLTLGLLASAAATTSATIRRVPSEYPSLQAALTLGHSAQDTVLVAPGTYSGAFLLAQGTTVLLSEGGAAVTVLDGTGNSPAIGGSVLTSSFSGTSTVIRGFTLRHGNADAGGAVNAVETALRFEDCVFVDNQARSGGAAFARDASLVFVRCEFRRNRATNGDGGAVLAAPFHALACFEDCLIVDNEASGLGGGLVADGNITNLELTRTTLAGNRATGGDNFALLNLGALAADHAIVSSPTSTHSGLATAGAGPANFTCSLMSALGGDGAEGFTFPAGSAGNLVADPEFCDAAGGDYALAATSPAATAACGRMGARGVGCTVVPVRRGSWGAIKSRYR